MPSCNTARDNFDIARRKTQTPPPLSLELFARGRSPSDGGRPASTAAGETGHDDEAAAAAGTRLPRDSTGRQRRVVLRSGRRGQGVSELSLHRRAGAPIPPHLSTRSLPSEKTNVYVCVFVCLHAAAVICMRE